jgi:hypothetical protein
LFLALTYNYSYTHLPPARVPSIALIFRSIQTMT